jgi:hypothetical protein
MAVGIPAQHEPSQVLAAASAMPSQIRVECTACKQHAYIPRKAYEEGFELVCGTCDALMFEARK